MDTSATTTSRKRGLNTPERVQQKRAKTETAEVPGLSTSEDETQAAAAEAPQPARGGLSGPIRIAGPSAWTTGKVVMKFARSPPLKSPRKAKGGVTTPEKGVLKVQPLRFTATPQRKSTSSTGVASQRE